MVDCPGRGAMCNPNCACDIALCRSNTLVVVGDMHPAIYSGYCSHRRVIVLPACLLDIEDVTVTIAVITLLVGAGGSAIITAQISKWHYQRQAEKRLARLEFMRQIKKMQQIQQAKAQNIEAVQSATNVEEVANALDDIYRSFDFGD